jgi:hypothetical protein
MNTKLGAWGYRHHNDTPIAKAASGRPHPWFHRGQRVVVDNAAVGYLNGRIGVVVALQTSAVVVKLGTAPATSRYVDDQNCVRFNSSAIRLEV